MSKELKRDARTQLSKPAPAAGDTARIRPASINTSLPRAFAARFARCAQSIPRSLDAASQCSGYGPRLLPHPQWRQPAWRDVGRERRRQAYARAEFEPLVAARGTVTFARSTPLRLTAAT
jgi:hypothetical protein